MSTQMSHLETLICAALQQQSLPEKDRNIDHTVKMIIEEKERILTTIHDEENLEAYVQARQQQLVRLIDMMLAACPPVAMDHTYKSIYRTLTDLLQFLEKNFAAYLDEDCKVPFNYLLNTQFHLSGLIKDLELELDVNECEMEYRELITGPFYKLLAVKTQDFFYSYHEIVYLRRLVGQLLKTPLTSWAELLISLDFNDPDYVEFMIEIIRSEFTDVPDASHRKETLLEWQRIIRQVAVRPGMYYKKLHQPLKEQLLFWIAEELYFISSNSEKKIINPWEGFKIPVSLTVLQLGRFIGLLLEAGVIQIENKKELALFISIFFSTPQRDYISPSSIRRSYYDKNDDVAESLRKIFNELISISKKP